MGRPLFFGWADGGDGWKELGQGELTVGINPAREPEKRAGRATSPLPVPFSRPRPALRARRHPPERNGLART
jgi:hypothetical protein